MRHRRKNDWASFVVTGVAVVVWAVAAVHGYAWQTVWLPAAVAGAAWPRHPAPAVGHCLRRLRRKEH